MSEEDDGKISILGAAITRFSDILQLKKLHAKIADIEAHLGDLDADHDGVVIIRLSPLIRAPTLSFSRSPLNPCASSLALSFHIPSGYSFPT
jgi:hypothetical protein